MTILFSRGGATITITDRIYIFLLIVFFIIIVLQQFLSRVAKRVPQPEAHEE